MTAEEIIVVIQIKIHSGKMMKAKEIRSCIQEIRVLNAEIATAANDDYFDLNLFKTNCDLIIPFMLLEGKGGVLNA